MKTPTIAELAARAEAMLPALKQRAARAEAEGHLPQETIDEFREAGFFRVFVPKRYGGLELDTDLRRWSFATRSAAPAVPAPGCSRLSPLTPGSSG